MDTSRDGILVMEVKKASVKDMVELHTRGKVKFECHLAFTDHVENLVRTEAFVVEFS